MVLIALWPGAALSGCVHAAPAGPTPSAEFDAIDVQDLDAWQAHEVALRAHAAVLALEAEPDAANRPGALAAARARGDAAGLAKAPFYGEIGGLVLDLHDLRNAQLLAEDPSLSGAGGSVAVGRQEHVNAYLPLLAQAQYADSEHVLALLRSPSTASGH